MRRLGAVAWSCLALAAGSPNAHASSGDLVEELRRVNIPFEQTYRRRVALCLGVNEYAAFPSLEYAVADAQSVGAQLRSYGFDEVLVWANGDISKDRVEQAIGRGIRCPRHDPDAGWDV